MAVSFEQVETLLSAMMNQSGIVPYLIVFTILLLCGFGLPVPEDVVLFAAGMMAFYHRADVWIMIAVCFAGVMIGDSTVFMIGNFYGRQLRRKSWVKRFLPPARMRMVRKKLHEQGSKVIFAARFMPGLRTPVFFTSGTLHLPFRVFLMYDGLAALLSVPSIVFATYFFGNHVDRVIRVVKRLQFGVVGTILVVVGVLALKAWLAHKKQVQMELEAARESAAAAAEAEEE